MTRKKAAIIGAGPAGLTAAYELLNKTNIIPIIFESTGDIGGISKTVEYKGNRLDIGGHRFFSKSDKVIQWWLEVLPLQGSPAKDDLALGRLEGVFNDGGGPDPEVCDQVMLIRSRLSRILYLRKFFNYPVSLDFQTIGNLGLIRIFKVGTSYAWAKVRQIKQEKSLEDFFVNRFGRELYRTFFKDYTEKVWGVSCDRIKPEWGAQRVKGLSVTKVIKHAIKNVFTKDRSIAQRDTETSLIERFLYPKLGPGQLWETVAAIVTAGGAELFTNHKIVGLAVSENRVESVTVQYQETGELKRIPVDYVLSSMPIKDLIKALGDAAPQAVRRVADGLVYRDFITVGVLMQKLKIDNSTKIRTIKNIIPDNWIYVQEKDVKLGRIQIFNNWSPYMVKDENTVWVGLEYFCNQGDEFWEMGDDTLTEFAVSELVKIGFVDKADVLDTVVVRIEKAYPAYFGSYAQFDVIKDFTDGIENLFLIGRNGMHRYNNQDHSMLTAMQAVDNIQNGIPSKDNIWAVNADKVYNEG